MSECVCASVEKTDRLKQKQNKTKAEKQQQIQFYTSAHSNTCRACPFRCILFRFCFIPFSIYLSRCLCAESKNYRLVSRSLLIFPEQKKNDRMKNCSIAAYIRNSFFILLSISFLFFSSFLVALLLLLLSIDFHRFHVSHLSIYCGNDFKSKITQFNS